MLLDEPPVVAQPEPVVAAAKAPVAAPAPKATKPAGFWFQKYSVVLLFVALLSIPAYFIASRYVVTAVVVQGRSMMPTLKDGERYYLNRWRYLFVAPNRGDIVVIRDPGHSDLAVKRIVAQPYDWINLRNGNIYINGRRLDESYLAKDTRTDAPDLKEKWIQLGADQYYVMGDNRSNSEDSRFYGRVTRKNILGHLIK
jgi:signal peptidase I